MNSLTLGFLKRATLFFFYIYVIALTCSMAGMEITSWSAAFFFLLYFVSSLSIVRGEAARLPDCDRVNIYSTGIELIFFLFIAVVTLGLTLNGPQEDFIFSIGMLRNFALFFFFVYILQFVKNISKIFTIIGICATVIAVYGIWQHFTGIDLWRHNNRALVLIPDSAKLQYATVGFFNHHLTYGHSYMMILCLPWAALLLWNQKKIGWGRLSLALVSFSLILTSLIYTYGRGVWLAILITIPLMTFIVSRRIFVVVAVAISLFAGVLLKYDLDFRGRALSIFAEKYKSNDERVKLWEANVAMFKDHPLIGVGYHQNEALSMHYYQKLGIQSGMAGHAHNNYIQILSTTGMCGFILYLIFINFFLIQTIRLYFAIPKDKTEDRIFALAAIGAQLVFHIGGFTQWNFGDMKVQHQYFFWLAAVTYMCHRYKVETHLQHRLLSAIGTSISTTFKKIRPWVSDPYTLAVGLFSFIMVFMKKWEPGGNLDTIWYSSVAKNIALTGNYFHFYISKYYFREIFDHMPMTYWIVGTILRIFGPSDLAARIYPMICSFLSYVLIYKIGSKIKNKEFGLLALVVHALCFGASKWNGAVMHDVPLTTFYLASFYFFILGLEQAKYFYLTALFFAFGVFTKGPIIFGFFLGLVLWSLWERKLNFLKERNFYGALIFLLGILMVPLLPQFWFGDFNIYAMFLIWKSSYVRGVDWTRYFAYFVVTLQTSTVTVVPYMFAPFLMKHERDFSRQSVSILKLALFISLSIIVPLSVFAVKFPHYLLPFYPFLSIVATYVIWKLYKAYPLPWPLTKICIWTATAAAMIFVSLPIKTTGKRSKEVLNLVNLIKLDHNIKNKDVYFYGRYSDDMTIFQTFKFYGSIDLKSVRLDQLKDVDINKSYLIIKRRQLPMNYGGARFEASQCVVQNTLYCVITARDKVAFDIPEYLFPHEIY